MDEEPFGDPMVFFESCAALQDARAARGSGYQSGEELRKALLGT